MNYAVRKFKSDEEIESLKRGEIVDFDLKDNFSNYIGPPIGPVVYEGRMNGKMLFCGKVPASLMPGEVVFQAKLTRQNLTIKPDGRLGLLAMGDEEIILASPQNNKRMYQQIRTLLDHVPEI